MSTPIKKPAFVKAGTKPKRSKATISRLPAFLGSSSKSERKAVDTNRSGMNFNSTGTNATLNGLIPGTNLHNRIGRKIKMNSIYIQGDINLSLTPAAATLDDHLRLMLIYDRQPNGAIPSSTQFLLTVNTAGTTKSNAQSLLNLGNSNRFIILRDWHWKASAHPAAAPAAGLINIQSHNQSWSKWQFKAFVKLRGLASIYNTGSAGTVADIDTGHLFLFATSLVAAANNAFEFVFVTRLRFEDA